MADPPQRLKAWTRVLYNDGASLRLRHQRRVLGMVESWEAHVLVCTPDDVYSEMLLDSDRGGVTRAECYRFRADLSPGELAAREVAAVAPATEMFVEMERVAGRLPVAPLGGAVRLLGRGRGCGAPAGPPPDGGPGSRGAKLAPNARILELRMVEVPAGTAPSRRRRPWRDAVAMFSVVEFSDWPLPGPRAVAWCVAFINRQGGGPADHHLFFKQARGLSKTDWGVDAHGAFLRQLEEAGCYDGLDVANAAALEVALRYAQLVEYVYAQEAAGGCKGKGKHGKSWGLHDRVGLADEASVFAGTLRDAGDATIAPDLLDYVAKEFERGASVMKQVRKAREERRLLASQQPPAKG